MSCDIFKVCPKCSFEWKTRDHFLGDPRIELIGYQVDFRELAAGLFLFNHICKGTLAIKAKDFEDLYSGPIFRVRATGTDECPGYCLHKKELKPCPAQCECSYVRDIIQIITCYNECQKNA